MSKRFAWVCLALFAAACAGTSEPLRRQETQVVEFRARVAAVEHDQRLVTLRDAAGGEATSTPTRP
jgi:cytochrome oxidase Cu insertion factor (SCO1/SenC/PrrC family)